MKQTRRYSLAVFVLALLFVQGLAQLEAGLAMNATMQQVPVVLVQQVSQDDQPNEPYMPFGIPDQLGAPSYGSGGNGVGDDFLAYAKYAWTGKAPPGLMLPAAASVRASSGDTYEAAVHRALDVLVHYFPEEVVNINSDRDKLVASIINSQLGKRVHPRWHKVKHAAAPAAAVDDTVLATAVITPCVDACITVIVDTVGLMVSIVGVAGTPGAYAKVATGLRNILRTTGANWAAGFQALFNDIFTADSYAKKAWAIGQLVSQIFSQGWKWVLQAFKSSMSWYEWILSAAGIVLAIGAFTVSGGAYLIIKAVQVFCASLELTLALTKAIKICA